MPNGALSAFTENDGTTILYQPRIYYFGIRTYTEGKELSAHDSEMHTDEKSEMLDVGSLFKGTATITLVAEIVAAIMLLGSATAYVISRSGLIEEIEFDVAVFLLLGGAMITLFIFLAAIGFFVRFNRKIGRSVIGDGIGSVDLKSKGVKTVVIIYGLAVGLILIIGVYGYWLVYKYFFAAIALTSLSFLGISLSLGILVMSFLVQVVIATIGRTATTIIRKVLAEDM
ncbi:MAG: hypothetical protein C4K48_02655 [Candidatus Thorarchaeota archaeon]|nr:MAG: hypothetical protein C4K48_02655 [Candidatus Thorarchaeota archaeon]